MNSPVYIRRSKDVAARRFGDELMIMSGKTSSLFSLNETASILWKAADGITPLADIVAEQICSEFDVNADSAMSDARAMLDDLAGHGILEISGQPLVVEQDPQA